MFVCLALIPVLLLRSTVAFPIATSFARTRYSSRSQQFTPLLASTTSETTEQSLDGLEVGIVGAGPSGLLLAHRLLKGGASKVNVFEARNDPRLLSDNLDGRAYALGVGIRGRTAIQSVSNDLWEAIKARGYESERFNLYINGIRINLRDGSAAVQGKTTASNVPEPSVLLYQTDLCAALLDTLEEKYGKDRLVIQFQEKIADCNLKQGTLAIQSNGGDSSLAGPFDILVGCDGVNSVIRKSIEVASPAFVSERKVLSGEFKVCRLNVAPPKLDSTSVALLLPKKGAVTAFVEPTVNGSSCILFAGRGGDDKDPILGTATDKNTTAMAIVECFPLLQGADVESMAEQLATQKTSSASSVQCNVYHYGSIAALCGDAAHATGGVSGQGVNSALVDSSVLADCLEIAFHSSNQPKEVNLGSALLAYSQRQVPEGHALYDLSFGPSPSGAWKKLRYALSSARDTIFRGRYGIGQPPLQTLLTTSLRSFADIRRDRATFYDDPFPEPKVFNDTIAKIY